jgi:tetratricopeptide (TPR) repeat protein
MRTELRTERRATRGRRGTCYVIAGLIVAAVVLTSCGDQLGGARALEQKGDLKGAVAAYRQALQHDPKNVAILALLGADLLLLGNYDEALPVEEQVVALDPKDVQTRVELGFNYLNHQHQPVKAVECLNQAAALQPTAKHLTFLAEAQIVAGDPSGAEQSLDKALKTDPKYPYTYFVLLSLLNSQGRANDASRLREQARLNGVDLSQAAGS